MKCEVCLNVVVLSLWLSSCVVLEVCYSWRPSRRLDRRSLILNQFGFT